MMPWNTSTSFRTILETFWLFNNTVSTTDILYGRGSSKSVNSEQGIIKFIKTIQVAHLLRPLSALCCSFCLWGEQIAGVLVPLVGDSVSCCWVIRLKQTKHINWHILICYSTLKLAITGTADTELWYSVYDTITWLQRLQRTMLPPHLGHKYLFY